MDCGEWINLGGNEVRCTSKHEEPGSDHSAVCGLEDGKTLVLAWKLIPAPEVPAATTPAEVK